jgi:hypothetical protein
MNALKLFFAILVLALIAPILIFTVGMIAGSKLPIIVVFIVASLVLCSK